MFSPAEIIAHGMRAAALVWDFNSTNNNQLTSAGEKTSTPYQVDASNYVVISHLTGRAWLAAASGTSIIGTPLADFGDPSPPASVGNTLPNTSLIGLNMLFGERERMAENFVRWPNLIGTAQRPFALPSLIILEPRKLTKWIATAPQLSGVTLDMQICAHGFYVPPDAVDEVVARIRASRV